MQAFLECAIHDEHVILGKKMQPFCLRHYLILLASKNPLLVGGVITRLDLQRALLICSSKSNQEYFSLKDGWRERYWFSKTAQCHVTKNKNLFNDYIDDYFPSFPMWENEDEGSEERVPWLFVCGSRLIDSVGIEGVKNMPLGEMIAWGMAKIEAEGRKIDGLMTETEVAALKEIEAETA